MMEVRVANQELERIEVLLSPGEIEKIDSWRSELQIGSRGDAIRRLIKLGLKASDGDGAPTPIVTPKSSSSSR
jgi:hypothetical protein